MISIIVPCYNAGEFLEDTIDSVEIESQDDEIILIDDGSNDRTKTICIDSIKKYNNIKFYSFEKNQGLISARNKGLELADGEWIMFLDADDRYSPNSIKNIKNYIVDKSELDIVFFNFDYVYKNKVVKNSSGVKTGEYKKEEIINHLGYKITWPYMSCVGSKIYKTRFISQNNIRFDSKCKYNEDAAFIIDALFKANLIGIYDKASYEYYQHGGSIMHSYRSELFNSLSVVTNKYAKLLDCEKVTLNHDIFICVRKVSVFFMCLKNEIFNKNKNSFIDLFANIRGNKDNLEAIKKVIVSKYSPIKERIFAIFIYCNLRNTLYYCLKSLI